MNAADANGGGPSGAVEADHGDAPTVNVLGQYLKDLSFENPNAPQSMGPRDDAPELTINVNVDAKKMGDADFEVTLSMEAEAKDTQNVLFNVEISYAGVFRVANLPDEHLQPFMMIECPRLLFPFARQIMADATRDGGFPPLMIDPIDFAALFQQNIAQQAANQT